MTPPTRVVDGGEGKNVVRRWVILAVLTSVVVTACGSTTPSGSPPSSLAVASPTAATSSAPSESASAGASASSAASASASSAASPSVSPNTEPTASPDPTATPAPTPAPTPVPWLSRTSKHYKYSIKYPPTWVATPGSTKFSDEYDDYSSHYVYVSRDTVSGTVSLSLTVSDDIRYEKSHYKAKLVSNHATTVAGWHGKLLIYTGTERDGRKVLIQRVILAKGKVAYFVDMFSDRGATAADEALFKQIYKTFKPKS
jgi:hypothetical protein